METVCLTFTFVLAKDCQSTGNRHETIILFETNLTFLPVGDTL